MKTRTRDRRPSPLARMLADGAPKVDRARPSRPAILDPAGGLDETDYVERFDRLFERGAVAKPMAEPAKGRKRDRNR